MENCVVSCHAASTGTTFTHGKDLWIFQFDYPTLHHKLAQSMFDALVACKGNLQKATMLWDTMRTGDKVKANTYFFKAKSPIGDYKLWALGAPYDGVNGIFDFNNFKSRLIVSGLSEHQGEKLSSIMSEDTQAIFWLACTS